MTNVSAHPNARLAKRLLQAAAFLLLLSCDEQTAPEKIARLQVEPASLDLMVTEIGQLQAIPQDEAGNILTRRFTTWASRDQSVATVNPAGLVTAVGIGQTIITGTAEGVSADVPVSVIAAVGEVDVTVNKIGRAADPQGFQVLIDGQTLGDPLTTLGHRIVQLPVGRHTASITGIESHCDLLSAPSQVVFVVPRQRVLLYFSVACLEEGQLKVKTVTTGQRTSSDPYRLSIDGGAGVAIDANTELQLELRPRKYLVALNTMDTRCLVKTAIQQVEVFEGYPITIQFQVRCYPDPPSLAGERLVMSQGSDFGSGLEAMDPDGANRFTVATGPAGTGDAALSRDGRRLAYRRLGAGGSNLVILDVGSLTESVSAGTSRISSLSWSPDGQRLVTGLTSNNDLTSLAVLRVDGTLDRSFGQNLHAPVYADWSPDGSTIAFTRGDHDVTLVNPDGTNVRVLRSVVDRYFEGADWSPDGRTLLVRSYKNYCYYYYSYCYPFDARVVAIDVATGKENLSVAIPDYAFGFVWGRTTSEVYFIQGGDVHYSRLDAAFVPVNLTRSPENEWSVLWGNFQPQAPAAVIRPPRR